MTRNWIEDLDQRIRLEIAFSQDYIANYNHGAIGHVGYMTVDKLAQKLDDMENITMIVITPKNPEDMARLAYSAFYQNMGGLDHDDKAIPSWDDLSDKERNSWIESIKLVLE